MKRKFNPLPIALFAAVIAVILFSASRILLNALAGETNADLIEFVAHPCEPLPMAVGSRMAVLRIDDIQAYAWSGISKQMITDAHTRGINPVLGVIPKNLEEDQGMYQFLRSVRCRVETALHGWGNQDTVRGEFVDLSRAEAERLIKKGKSVLEILTRRDVSTFIPPNNELSAQASELLRDARIAVSSEGDHPFDFSATTFDFVSDVPVPAARVVDACESKFSTSELCVIMMHPQDFATPEGKLDPVRYQDYLIVLDRMLASKTQFVTFEFLIREKWSADVI